MILSNSMQSHFESVSGTKNKQNITIVSNWLSFSPLLLNKCRKKYGKISIEKKHLAKVLKFKGKLVLKEFYSWKEKWLENARVHLQWQQLWSSTRT